MREAYYKKGQPHGKTVEYYPDGAEKEVCYYRKGKPEGGEIAYYPNGDLRRKGSYLRGKKNGVFEEYYKNGAVKTSITYRRGKPVPPLYAGQPPHQLHGIRQRQTRRTGLFLL